MSNLCLSGVLENSKSKGVARLVLIIIADRANDDGTAWPGSEFIASRANISRQNVCRAIRDLIALGEVVVQCRQGDKNCNLYQISDTLITRQSHSETVSPRVAGGLMVRQKQSHGETQSQVSQYDPNKADFIGELKTHPDFQVIDVEKEAAFARRWIAKKKGRRFTKRFFENWLERAIRSKPSPARKGGGVVLESSHGGRVQL